MGPTPTRTSSPTSARGSSRGSLRVRRAWPVQLADLSADFCKNGEINGWPYSEGNLRGLKKPGIIVRSKSSETNGHFWGGTWTRTICTMKTTFGHSWITQDNREQLQTYSGSGYTTPKQAYTCSVCSCNPVNDALQSYDFSYIHGAFSYRQSANRL